MKKCHTSPTKKNDEETESMKTKTNEKKRDAHKTKDRLDRQTEKEIAQLLLNCELTCGILT